MKREDSINNLIHLRAAIVRSKTGEDQRLSLKWISRGIIRRMINILHKSMRWKDVCCGCVHEVQYVAPERYRAISMN